LHILSFEYNLTGQSEQAALQVNDVPLKLELNLGLDGTAAAGGELQ